jgi:uncharacterized protein (DUF362 family)
VISIVTDDSLAYPASGDAFGPAEDYPEYRFGQAAARSNGVYAAVRRLFADSGLDQAHFGTAGWNPLGAWVRPGQRVFVLCNFVYHRRPRESEEAFLGKCTHASVIRAVIDYLLIAVGPRGRVRFGNAPLQGCKWEEVTRQTGAAELAEFYRAAGAPVDLCDLRLHVAERNAWGWISKLERRGDAEGVVVDLAGDSLLASLDASAPRYRVLDYDPQRTEACHADGSHLYILNRAILESDLIVSIPKLKTHEKVGMTCALKGCVGAIAHKDCLAHHRQGPPAAGGDEYPGDPTGVLRVLSRMHDRVQCIPSESRAARALRVLDRATRKLASKAVTGTGGAWWGNDTAWRMTLDIARCIAHADLDGRLHDEQQRPHLALIDGVIGGEGAGPLAPDPVHSGALLWSDNPVEADEAAAILMGYDPQRLALVREARRLARLPILAPDAERAEPLCNGRRMTWDELRAGVRRKYCPPAGWVGRL